VQLREQRVFGGERQRVTGGREVLKYMILTNVMRVNKLRRIRRARQAAGQEKREVLKHCRQNTRRL
jgi:hypothetical protein